MPPHPSSNFKYKNVINIPTFQKKLKNVLEKKY